MKSLRIGLLESLVPEKSGKGPWGRVWEKQVIDVETSEHVLGVGHVNHFYLTQ